MDKTGKWTLSPAYDIGFAYNPKGSWTDTHQMSINGKFDDLTGRIFLLVQPQTISRMRLRLLIRFVRQHVNGLNWQRIVVCLRR